MEVNALNTPICDFVENYVRSGAVRMHMPGHKGHSDARSQLPVEAYDITEIEGADELFHAKGIIAESEQNASELFGCDTYYSTEGASLTIRAMLYLCCTRANSESQSTCAGSSSSRPWVLAARNIHQSFVSAAALLDLDVTWIFSKTSSLLSMDLSAEEVREELRSAKENGQKLPCCVYLTSPDYLGHILPIGDIAEVCHEYGVPLVVDNAHGAYLKFLEKSLHPIDLGADLCCDSAHKTLPVLTGGAYLHVSPAAKEKYAITNEKVKQALHLFASTSPSWLILQSLDRVNKILAEDFRSRLLEICGEVFALKTILRERGFKLFGEEPLKITIQPRSYGYTGSELAAILRQNGKSKPIEAEFADMDSIVLMVSVNTTKEEMQALKEALLAVSGKETEAEGENSENKNTQAPFPTLRPKQVMRIREACFAPFETVPLEQAEGRIAHMFPASCPPAVPIVVCGEKIEAEEISCLHFYGYNFCQVVADQP